MKRLYETVVVAGGPDGIHLTLDGRPLKTPRKRLLALPSPALADLVAAEWAAQGDEIQPATMPINRLATTAVDLMPDRRSGAIEQVADYARTDLLCYRATYPADLVAAQATHWDPPLAWLGATYGVKLVVASGLMPTSQPRAAVTAVAELIARLPDWPLVGVHALTTATGSVVLGLMVRGGALTAVAAAEAALVDEHYEQARWGDEDEARKRETRLRADLDAAAAFLGALEPQPAP